MLQQKKWVQFYFLLLHHYYIFYRLYYIIHVQITNKMITKKYYIHFVVSFCILWYQSPCGGSSPGPPGVYISIITNK